MLTSMPKKTQEEVIANFIKKHGDRYDYSLVKYKSAVTKVNVICRDHGVYAISPNSHLNGSGCSKCGRISTSTAAKITIEEFVKRAREVHGDMYDYSKSVYISYISKITIICPKHGAFAQKVSKHLGGNKCKKCVAESAWIDFVGLCKNKFPEYNYDKVEYRGMYTPVVINCPKHGDFLTKPANFYHKGRTCKKCINMTSSKPEKMWLDELGIPLNCRNVYMSFGSKTYCLDGVDLSTKTIYEFYGDFYHGNPNIYDMNQINPLLKETYGSLYDKTMAKEKAIKDSGYKLITIWEDDFKKNK